ncbi:hypothetical protein Tco_0429046 [Tanacetum coccineum]
MKQTTSSTSPHNTQWRYTRVSFVEEALTWVMIDKQGTLPSMIRVLVTIKILVMTNLHIILRVSHNSLTVVSSHLLRDSNQDIPVDLYYSEGNDAEDMEIDSLTMEPLDTLLMGDEDSSTNPARESGVTSGNNLECDMPVTIPFPTTDFREENFDINSPLGEHVVDFLMENEDITDFPRYLVKQILSHSVKNPSSTKRMPDEPLGDDSKPRSYDVTFSNSLFDFNDDYTLCYDNPLFNDEFEDISSLDPPESTPVIDESTLWAPLPGLPLRQQVGFHVSLCGTAMSADWVLLACVAATSAADMEITKNTPRQA